MNVYGAVDADVLQLIAEMINQTEGLHVQRRQPARSTRPLPGSEDLEVVLIPILERLGFVHHLSLVHPRTGDGFEYDFFQDQHGIAMEIMGYRADDEVYKDVLKFHVHQGTRVGIFWVPRWKWIGDSRKDTNYRATLKAVSFADDYIDVDGLIVLPYDWFCVDPKDNLWELKHV